MSNDINRAANHISRFLTMGTMNGVSKAQAGTADDDKTAPQDHDKNVKHAVHNALKTAHKHAFSPDTRSLDEAKAKHSAFVAFSEPDDGYDDKLSK